MQHAAEVSADTYTNVQAYAKQVLPGTFFSSYRSNTGGASITNDSGVEGKVALQVGVVNVTEEQAKQLLDLVASFKKG